METVDKIIKYTRISPNDSLRILKAISPTGRLCRQGLIAGSIEKAVRITRAVFEGIISNNESRTFTINSHESLLKLIYELSQMLEERSVLVMADSGDLSDINSEIKRAYNRFRIGLSQHPDWPMSRMCQQLKLLDEELVLVILIARELEYLSEDSNLYTGKHLVAALSLERKFKPIKVNLLRSTRPLRRNNYIQICGGLENSPILTENDVSLKKCEFELTPACMADLKLVSQRQSSRSYLRKPVIQFKRLVVSVGVKEAIQMGISQIKNAHQIFSKWGLNETIPYGCGAVMLFYGPPGCGKTAAAEAIAHELGRDLLTVNYAEVMNCWVGQTEKNISKMFQTAVRSNAVLFWDEADAMFYDRETAMRSFEIREVNVLLQEIERFHGVCILATNRLASLDKALERRISLKIEFSRPDRELRKDLWRVLLPDRLPLAKDVSIEALAEEDFSGGQIKNVILNAARIAVMNKVRNQVSHLDFEKAIKLEKEGSWSEGRKLFGFGKKSG